MKHTRGCAEGAKRCQKCDAEGKGVYECHAGLMDFSIDIVLNGEKLGAVIGGQVLPNEPNEESLPQSRKNSELIRALISAQSIRCLCVRKRPSAPPQTF